MTDRGSYLLPVCNSNQESLTHLFFQCQKTKTIWNRIRKLCNIQRVEDSNEEIIQWLSNDRNTQSFKETNQTVLLSCGIPGLENEE